MVVIYVVLWFFYFFFFKQKTAYEIRLSLVGSEMCIRDRSHPPPPSQCRKPGCPPHLVLSLIHISEPTRLRRISYAVFCLKKKKHKQTNSKLSFILISKKLQKRTTNT